MKILLIYPYFIEERLKAEDIRVPPIGLYSISSVLKEQGYDVEILNWHDADNWPEKIFEVLQEKNPDVIGFSILNANRWGGIEIARTAKQLNPEVTIVFGGVGATFLYEHLLTNFEEIDFIVLGEGETSFLNLVDNLKNDRSELNNIKGLAFRKNGRVIETGLPDRVKNLENLPVPAKYYSYQHISTSRGCAWNCTFCGSPAFWEKGVRFRPSGNVVEEIRLLYNQGVRLFYFSDDTLTMQKGRIIEICRQILTEGMDISWYAISRVDCIDEEILFWMRLAGCIQISYGIESGSEEIRDKLNKNIKIEDIRKAFKLTISRGILARAYFIYGSPGETWETIQASIDLIKEIKPLGLISYILDIYPGTELYEQYKQQFNRTDEIWLNKIEGIMYFETDENLTPEMILSFGKKLRDEFYSNLHLFIADIELVDNKDLYARHSDFWSRLGMTFSHGDYAGMEIVKEKEKTAEYCYKKSLKYDHNHRAYLGLGIMKQKAGAYNESIKILQQGRECFPEKEDLQMALGISFMNKGMFENASDCFRVLSESNEREHFLEICRKELSEAEKV